MREPKVWSLVEALQEQLNTIVMSVIFFLNHFNEYYSLWIDTQLDTTLYLEQLHQLKVMKFQEWKWVVFIITTSSSTRNGEKRNGKFNHYLLERLDSITIEFDCLYQYQQITYTRVVNKSERERHCLTRSDSIGFYFLAVRGLEVVSDWLSVITMVRGN